MEPKKYPRSVLRALCEGRGGVKSALPLYKCKPDGLWLKRKRVHSSLTFAEREVLTWHPRQDCDLPALPLPFTAHALAAFTLAGSGLFLLEPFEDDDHVPDEEALRQLGENGVQAQQAIRRAMALCRAALKRFQKDGEADVRTAARYLTRQRLAPGPVAPAPIQCASIQRMPDNDRRVREAIEAECLALGIDTMPSFKRGNKADPFKAQVLARSGLSEGAFRHAWKAVTKGTRPLKRPRTG